MTELSAVVRFVHLAAAVLLAGSFSFALLVARPAFMSAADAEKPAYFSFLRLQLGISRWCLLVFLLSALLGLGIQAMNVSETSRGVIFDFAALFSLATETQFGKVWLARMFLALILSGFFLAESRRQAATVSLAVIFGGFVLTACLLATLALASHASAAEGSIFALQVSVDALHLLAAGVWLGGLAPLADLLRRCTASEANAASAVARTATRRFSALALASVLIIIATGGYNAWNLVGGFAPLFGTAYGQLLLAKLGLLMPLLTVAAVNLRKLKPQLLASPAEGGSTPLVRKLKRNVLIEATIGMLILLIVGHLSVTPPALHVQPDWPFSFRWNWSDLTKLPYTRGEVQRGLIWGGIGGISLIAAATRRRRRALSIAIGFAATVYAGKVIHTAVSIDAYPSTFQRPSVAYHAISIASGQDFYQESGCIACHGPSGYGDGAAGQDLSPKPADLTARHATAHTAGDLFWWLTYGVDPTTAMPGFDQSLSAEERWDLINFLRALSSGEKARSLAPVIENEPWLVAPDFTYETNTGETRTLRDHRGNKIVLLVLLNLQDTEVRLGQIAGFLPQLRSAGVEIIIVPNLIDYLYVAHKLPGLIVNEGIREITETYKLFARSLADDKPLPATPHVEYLIDKQGYIRARWLPAEGTAWEDFKGLISQVDLLRKEKPRAPAPDEHVH
jgi:putative copper resistance protein D